MSGHLFVTSSWSELGFCSRTMIQNTPANPPLNGWRKTKWRLLEWPSQSPDLNPIEMLWHDLKKAVHARKPSNVAELQQFCQDEWAKIPPQRVAWRWSVCGTAECMEAQVSLTVAFSSSAFFGLLFLIFLLTIPHIFSMEFRYGEFAGQSSTPTPWSFNQLLVLLAVWEGAKSCWKMKSASLKSWSAEGSMKCSKNSW